MAVCSTYQSFWPCAQVFSGVRFFRLSLIIFSGQFNVTTQRLNSRLYFLFFLCGVLPIEDRTRFLPDTRRGQYCAGAVSLFFFFFPKQDLLNRSVAFVSFAFDLQSGRPVWGVVFTFLVFLVLFGFASSGNGEFSPEFLSF